MMERLTTNKDVSEMGMYELAHNSCYCKDGVARYRDFETDIDARDLIRQLAWSLADIELSRNDDEFDEQMFDNLQYDIMKEPIGLIALFYRNLWAMADLREKLKRYEDEEDQGLLLRLPCKVGSTVYYINGKFILEYEVTGFSVDRTGVWLMYVEHHADENDTTYGFNFDVDKIGKTVFLTQEEAEQKLKEMESK